MGDGMKKAEEMREEKRATFQHGQLVRYGNGSAAFGKIESSSPNHGVQGHFRFWGKSINGFSFGAYEYDCIQPQDEDFEIWNEKFPNDKVFKENNARKNIQPESMDDMTKALIEKELANLCGIHEICDGKRSSVILFDDVVTIEQAEDQVIVQIRIGNAFQAKVFEYDNQATAFQKYEELQTAFKAWAARNVPEKVARRVINEIKTRN